MSNDTPADGVERSGGSEFTVEIAAGCVVVYRDEDGYQATLVESVHEDEETIVADGVPGVLRLQDILAVGVYGDEAEFELNSDGTGGDRIQLLGGERDVQ